MEKISTEMFQGIVYAIILWPIIIYMLYSIIFIPKVEDIPNNEIIIQTKYCEDNWLEWHIRYTIWGKIQWVTCYPKSYINN